MLQGVIGLQLMEALHLQWENVDLEAGTITVEDIDEHQLKNDERCRITPKDLRNTLQDHAEKNGWNKFFWERFAGHAARDISGKHYVGSEAGKLTEDFRREIVEKIDQVVEGFFSGRRKGSSLARCSTFWPQQEKQENFQIESFGKSHLQKNLPPPILQELLNPQFMLQLVE